MIKKYHHTHICKEGHNIWVTWMEDINIKSKELDKIQDDWFESFMPIRTGLGMRLD